MAILGTNIKICTHIGQGDVSTCPFCNPDPAEGPTLRDQFAMAALPAVISEMPTVSAMNTKAVCSWAYELADAMLSARAARAAGEGSRDE